MPHTQERRRMRVRRVRVRRKGKGDLLKHYSVTTSTHCRPVEP
jgi:hypothetical protein